MRLQPIADRLREQAPSLLLIAGAAEIDGLRTPQMPAAFVLPFSETAGDNRVVGGVSTKS